MTIRLSTHLYLLLIFQQPGDTRADDFELTAKGLLKAYEASDPLKAAVSCPTACMAGRAMAYELLVAPTI